MVNGKHTADRMTEAGNRLSDTVARSSLTGKVQGAPIVSLLIGFGAGMVVGCMVAELLMRAAPVHEPSTTERLGRSVMHAFGGVIPETVSKRFAG